MGIGKKTRTIITFMFIATISPTEADTQDAIDYGLFLSPKNCYSVKKSEECELLVTIDWRTEIKGNYCLYYNLDLVPMHCWQDQQQAQKKFFLIVSKDVNFELRNKDTRKILFKNTVKVYKKVSHLRRKRRNPWSFY